MNRKKEHFRNLKNMEIKKISKFVGNLQTHSLGKKKKIKNWNSNSVKYKNEVVDVSHKNHQPKYGKGKLKRSPEERHTQKLIWNILAVTDIFLNQKGVNTQQRWRHQRVFWKVPPSTYYTFSQKIVKSGDKCVFDNYLWSVFNLYLIWLILSFYSYLFTV